MRSGKMLLMLAACACVRSLASSFSTQRYNVSNKNNTTITVDDSQVNFKLLVMVTADGQALKSANINVQDLAPALLAPGSTRVFTLFPSSKAVIDCNQCSDSQTITGTYEIETILGTPTIYT